MKKYKNIFFIALALIVGLGVGYLVFHRSPVKANNQEEHKHEISDKGEIWTCSMHPQIQQPEPGQCPICGMDLIPLDNSSSSSDNPLVLQMTNEATKLANVQTTIIGEMGKPEKTILLNGKIQVDERRSSSQVAHIPGRIEQLYVTFTGERIKKGQKLVTVYSPELVTAQRELLEALKFEKINAGLVEAARNKLRYWKIPLKTIGDIEKTGVIKETFTLYADVGGIVVNRKVSVGDYVKLGQILFDIIDLNNLWVLFDGYEEDLANIRIGDRVEFTTPAQKDKVFSTRITYIDPVINPQTRVASLRAEVNNRAGLLKPEMFVRGEIKSRLSENDKLMVPKSAVLWTGKRSVIYLKVPDMAVPSFEYREVVLGEGLGDSYLVEEGLEPGDEVVTNGSFSIDAAAQLNNQQSMMNKVVKVKGAGAPDVPNYMASTPDNFKEQLYDLSQKYLDLKDAFVETDAELAAGAADIFLQQLEKVDMSLVKGEAHLFWMAQLDGMKGHAGQITKTVDVEAQRKQFGFLSGLMIRTIEAFGIEGGELYVQHCPMAFNNEGADWLSDEEGIRNPYFGDAMLTCGTTKGTLPLKVNTSPSDQPQTNQQQFHNH